MNNIKLFIYIMIAQIVGLMLIMKFIQHHSMHPKHGNIEYVNYDEKIEKHPIHGMIKRVSYEVKLGCNAWDSCHGIQGVKVALQ